MNRIRTRLARCMEAFSRAERVDIQFHDTEAAQLPQIQSGLGVVFRVRDSVVGSEWKPCIDKSRH